MLFLPFLLTACGTVTVQLGTPLSGSVEASEATAANSNDTPGTGSSTGTMVTSVTLPTTCTPGPDTFANYAQAYLGDHCASCHTGKFDTLDEVKSDAAMQQSYIANGSMPPSSVTPLDANDQIRLVNWYLCKTP